MKKLRNIFLIILLIFYSSCDRISKESSKGRETEKNQTGTLIDSNTSKNDGLIEVVESANIEYESSSNQNGQVGIEVSNSLRQNASLNPQLDLLFLSFTWETWIIIFSIITLILLLLLIILFRKNTSLFNKIDEKNGKLNQKNDIIRQLQLNLQNSQIELDRFQNKEKSKSFKPDLQKGTPKSVQKYKNYAHDEGPIEVSFSLNNPTPISSVQEKEALQPISLYAEKANEENAFSNISEQKNEHKSIFKLMLEDPNANTAKFEVIDSDFILKMAANSPDIYLYTVCNPENSNQNFAGQIITTQKGIAHKVDGKWQVKDENKAKIKFQ